MRIGYKFIKGFTLLLRAWGVLKGPGLHRENGSVLCLSVVRTPAGVLENDLRAYVGSQVVSLLVSPHLLEARHALRSLQPAAKVRRHVGIESLQHGR